MGFVKCSRCDGWVHCIDDYLSDKLCTKLVILLDNGPDNSGVRTAFLKGLVDLSDKYQIEIIDEKDIYTILTIIVAITNDVDRSQSNSSN